MQKLLSLTLLLVLATNMNTCAQDAPAPELKSKEVRESIDAFGDSINLAKKSFEEGVSELTDKYNARVSKLRDEHLTSLGEHLKRTTQTGDLDESLKVRNVIESLKVAKIELPNMKLQVEVAKKKIIELEEQVAAFGRSKTEKLDRRNRTTLAGTWRWYDGNDTTFAPNGQAIHAGGTLKGKWHLVDASRASFLIDWGSGSTDAVVISEGGILLEGRASPTGSRVWAVRLK